MVLPFIFLFRSTASTRPRAMEIGTSTTPYFIVLISACHTSGSCINLSKLSSPTKMLLLPNSPVFYRLCFMVLRIGNIFNIKTPTIVGKRKAHPQRNSPLRLRAFRPSFLDFFMLYSFFRTLRCIEAFKSFMIGMRKLLTPIISK